MGAINALKDAINFVTAPAIFISLAAVLFFIALPRRLFWTRRVVLVGMIAAPVFVAASMLDPDFGLIVRKPDNVPIVAMLFLVGFFLWLSMHQAYQNDERIARGEPPLEGTPKEAEKTWGWPDRGDREMAA